MCETLLIIFSPAMALGALLLSLAVCLAAGWGNRGERDW